MLVNQQQLSQTLEKAKTMISSQEFEQANEQITQLQQLMTALFTSADFDKTIFLHPSEENLPMRELLIEIDSFLQNEVKNLTLTSQNIVKELSSLKTATKMKKAYGA